MHDDIEEEEAEQYFSREHTLQTKHPSVYAQTEAAGWALAVNLWPGNNVATHRAFVSELVQVVAFHQEVYDRDQTNTPPGF